MTVTAEHIRELMESQAMEPLLVRWDAGGGEYDDNAGDIDIVPAPLFNDISYCYRDRAHTVVASRDELADTNMAEDWDNLDDADCQAIADVLNEQAQ